MDIESGSARRHQAFADYPAAEPLALYSENAPHRNRLLLRIPEAADALGISRSKAYELVARGVLPAISVGNSKRIPVAALEAWIQSQLEQEWNR